MPLGNCWPWGDSLQNNVIAGDLTVARCSLKMTSKARDVIIVRENNTTNAKGGLTRYRIRLLGTQSDRYTPVAAPRKKKASHPIYRNIYLGISLACLRNPNLIY